jgi:hypothetical protein
MTYTDGKRGLHWDEGQSDWAKEGRKRGYAGDVEPSTSAVPDMPFKKNAWQTLNFKRMLRYAVENGYDRLTWAPGQVHKNRYGLEKHLDRIEINVSSRGAGKASEEPFTSGTLDAYNKDGQSTLKRHINSPEELEELVGKDVAKRLLGAEGKHTQRAGMGAFTREVKGADLKMGGEWADNLYDKQYPNIANKELKRLGIDQRVGRVDGAPKSLRYNVSDGSGLLNANLNRQQVDIVVPRYEMARGTPVTVETVTPQLHSIEITPELKEAVMGKGMTMFSAGGMLGGATAASMLSRYQGDEERPGI